MIIKTTNGPVRGGTKEGVHYFLGIPYAAAPEGAKRFKAPEAPAKWSSELDATSFGDVCLQAQMPGIFGDIGTPSNAPGPNSLNLNVWTPEPGDTKLPVLMWIHGGAFYAGSGIDEVYDGTAFARDGVVCVTINYRLGAQGFAHLAEQFSEFSDSGNCGILDQIAALEWIRDNIAAFGGDPSNVTIAGESAGGMSVGTLLATPKAKGLFRRAIPQSGAAHNGVSAATGSLIASHLLAEVNVRPGDIDALLKVSPENLLAAQVRLNDELAATRNPLKFGEAAASAMLLQPTYGTDVLPMKPIDAISAGSAKDVDIMVGSNSDETLIFMVDLKDIFNEELVGATLDAVMGAVGRSGEEALKTYSKARPTASSFDLASAFETDRMFRMPALRLAEAQLKNSKNVWVYEFCWKSQARDGNFGACHFLEVPFAFDRIDNEQSRGIAGDAPQSLATAVHAAWVAFIKHGNPNNSHLPEWPAYTVDTRDTMCFDSKSEVRKNPSADERILWDGII
jgi:para-nitrobenzyl esterase